MKQLYILIAALALATPSFSQTNYKAANLITLKGDTIQGFVDYREWNINPENINFKKSLTVKDQQKITPADVLAIIIPGSESYQTYVGPVTTNDISGNYMSNVRDTSFRIDNIFLKVLQKGKNVTLYSYEDRIKKRYFISEGVEPPKELTYRIYSTSEGQQTTTVYESTYKKQLSSVAGKHDLLEPALNVQIQRSDYDYANILAVVSKINGMKIAKEDNQNTSANYFYGGLGVNATHFTTGGEYKKAGGKPYTSIMPRITAGVNLFANSNTQKIAFRIEFSIGADKYESNYTNKVSPYNDIVFHFTQISYALSPQIVYNVYNQSKLKLYMAVGFQTSYAQYVNKAFKEKDGSDYTDLLAPRFVFNNLFNSAVFKIGATINKKIDIYADYLTVNEVNKDSYFLISSSGFQAGINYSFK